MGRKRSKCNRKKKNLLNNPDDKEKSNSSLGKEVKKEKVVTLNNSLPVQKGNSNLPLPKPTVGLSEKSSISIKSESNLLTSNTNDGLNQEYDHCKTTRINNKSTEDNLQISCVSKFSSVTNVPKSNKSGKLSNTSIKSVTIENQEIHGAKPKCLTFEPYLYHASNKSCLEEDYGSDDDYSCSTSDYFHPVIHDKYEDRRNFKDTKQKDNWEQSKMKESFYSSIKQYKNSKTAFSYTYCKWLPERKNTLEKLRSLYEEVHDGALKYNQAQASFREVSFVSRSVKQATENQTVDFFASLAAFVSDAVGGVHSLAEAFNIDSYQRKFQEIMDHDAEVTKELYSSRSQCVVKYQDVEEVIRKFHSDTFSSTVDKISNTLEMDIYWKAMKNAYQRDGMPELLGVCSNFFGNAFRPEVLTSVNNSVRRFVNDNPAVQEACKSAGRALFGAINTWGEKKDRNSVMGAFNTAANFHLMLEDKKEAEHRRKIVSEDTFQSKLECQIEDAIDSLTSEMKEINDIYFQLFKNFVSYDDDDGDNSDYYNQYSSYDY